MAATKVRLDIALDDRVRVLDWLDKQTAVQPAAKIARALHISGTRTSAALQTLSATGEVGSRRQPGIRPVECFFTGTVK